MTKFLKRKAVLFAVIALGLVIGAFAIDSYFDPFDDRPFDLGSWIANKDGVRMAMARDAICRIPVGTQESEIVRLLGEPDSIWESQRLTGSAPNNAFRTYSYYLGSSHLTSLRGLDSAFVWVHVGSDGRVVATVIDGG